MFVTNAQGFYRQLKTDKGFNLESLLDEKQSQIVARFCERKAPKLVFGKIRAVKSLVKGLIETGLIPKVKVKVCWFGKGVASMIDNGEIRLYKQFLFSQSYCESVLTVLHELAHVKLWANKDYSLLKKCDAEFFDEFVKDASCTVVCPIEYYANLFALCWLNQAIEQVKDQNRLEQLSAEKERLIEKLSKAKEKI